MSRRIAGPCLANAEAGHEGDGAVDDDRFPVIATEPAKRTVEVIPAADVDPGLGYDGHANARRTARQPSSIPASVSAGQNAECELVYDDREKSRTPAVTGSR